MTTPARAKQLSDIIRHAAQQAGVRVIVQAGWTNLDVADETVMIIGDTPHDWLFPLVAAVAHHCGAGTTAAGLRAGVARQHEAQSRLFTPFLITVGLVEAIYFINIAFMALFVFATPGK